MGELATWTEGMKTDRAADLLIVRELTERQKDQKLADARRAENLRQAERRSTPDEPSDQDWAGVKL